MQFTTVFVGAMLSATALAAPTVAEPFADLHLRANQWTLKNVSRSCTTDNSSCAWSYSIKSNVQALARCSYSVKGSPATHASVSNVDCSNFTISQSWSGQFGAGNGFTTLAIVGPAGKQVGYPAYRDDQLVNGKVVTPDLSFNLQPVP